ncbi:hypothetical protein ACE6H2_010992 [Prunus campanulata]
MCEWLLKVVIRANLNKGDVARVATSIASTCWYIWKFRCKAVIEGRPPSPLAAISAISAAELEFVDAVTAAHLNCPSPMPVDTASYSWTPPVLPRVKINLDAAWSPTSKQGGIGLVVCDNLGSFIMAMAIPCMANSAQEAEAMAAVEAWFVSKYSLELLEQSSSSKNHSSLTPADPGASGKVLLGE